MKQRDFWTGFACGAGTALGAALAVSQLQRGRESRILRLEKSIQIARPVEEVFESWSDFPRLAAMSSVIDMVRTYGDRSRWAIRINGIPSEWEAELTQFIPNEAIGWKSVSGPTHSGRVTFSPIGNDTLIHVQMNYKPPMRFMRRLLSPYAGDLEGYIEQVLRDFKTALERSPGRGEQAGKSRLDQGGRATGTYGPGPELLTENQNARFGGPTTPVEYTRPPDAKS